MFKTSDKFPNRTVYCGDNLEVLKKIPDNYVDAVCIDPPFNSGRNYTNFDDDRNEWKWNDDRDDDVRNLYDLNLDVYEFLYRLPEQNISRKSYLTFMAVRLCEIHRILMDHGSLFLICDDKEVAYLEILLDMIFGFNNKINLINYRRSVGRKGKRSETGFSKRLGRCSGYVLFYAKDQTKYEFDQKAEFRVIKDKEIEEKFPHTDGIRRYAQYPVTFVTRPETNFYGLVKKWMHNHNKMNHLLNDGRLYYIKNRKHITLKDGNHIRELVKKLGSFAVHKKEYPKEVNGHSWFGIDDTWHDVKPEQVSIPENGGHKGGKTEELIERILKFIKSPDDRPPRVLDAFLGFGTTAIIAEKLGYHWIGIDVSKENIEITQQRFAGAVPIVDNEEEVLFDGTPKQTDLFNPVKQVPKVKKTKTKKLSFPNVKINIEE